MSQRNYQVLRVNKRLQVDKHAYHGKKHGECYGAHAVATYVECFRPPYLSVPNEHRLDSTRLDSSAAVRTYDSVRGSGSGFSRSVVSVS